MSRTTRKDPIDVDFHNRTYIIMGRVFDCTPTEKEVIKAHADGKKHHKPGRKAKKWLNKGKKAKVKRALDKVAEDPDGAPMPRDVKDHVWRYN